MPSDRSFRGHGPGPDGLASLAAGHDATETLRRLVTADGQRAERQVGIVDTHGGSAAYTGDRCLAWAGSRLGDGFAAQGNILFDSSVVDGLADTFLAGGRAFPDLLVGCLAAADAAGGDRRGRESAALLVVREGGGYAGGNDRFIDLRVDQHDDPIGELGRLLEFRQLYFDRPDPATLQPMDEPLAAEIRSILESLGGGPGGVFGNVYRLMNGAPADDTEMRPQTREPGPLPSNWDDAWQGALAEWMDVENLGERTAAPGWIDPRVLAVLRSRRPT